MIWSLGNSCENKFNVGQIVKTRGDMGNFYLRIIRIYNDHYCQCRRLPWGKKRHFNMNCLESV